MKNIGSRYKKYFTDKSYLASLSVGIFIFISSLFVNFYAGTYATENASNSVLDLVLSNIPVFDVDMTFIYGPFLLWLFVIGLGLYEPKRIPFILKSIALFVIIRSVFITLTHLGPYPDQVILDINPKNWINKFAFGADLFFSGHTGLPFLMSLVFWDNKLLRIIFILTAIFFGVIVLLGHLHYSIDVLSAFFITYTIFHLAQLFFKEDSERFKE